MKERLDKALHNRGLVESREKAAELIKSGKVEVNGRVVKKPSYKVSAEDKINLKENFQYVSRAGYKLKRGIDTFGINVKDKVCLDVGASTGGFTDCLLQEGAKRVYAVDVGTDQLHPSLRKNPKVISFENTDARKLNSSLIPEPIDILTCDVSFISILKVLPFLKKLLKPEFEGIILIKPQFELSKGEVVKGIVKDKSLHKKAVKKVVDGLKDLGFGVKDLTHAKPFGTDGNIEFLAHINISKENVPENYIDEVVEKAHKEFIEERNGST